MCYSISAQLALLLDGLVVVGGGPGDLLLLLLGVGGLEDPVLVHLAPHVAAHHLAMAAG